MLNRMQIQKAGGRIVLGLVAGLSLATSASALSIDSGTSGLDQGGNASGARMNDGRDPIPIHNARINPGVIEGLAGGCDGELNEAIHAASGMPAHVIGWIETRHLTCNADG